MGRSAREKPRKLGKKLKHIRVVELELSQTEMAKALEDQLLCGRTVRTWNAGAYTANPAQVRTAGRSLN
jgi:hypothetical protein